MFLASPAFESTRRIPDRYTCAGENCSPPLSIHDPDPDSESLALLVEDRDAPGGVFAHWLIWNISPHLRRLPEGIEPQPQITKLGPAIQGRNDFGQLGYRGPCPPGEFQHQIRFTLYSLSSTLALKPGATRRKLLQAMEGKIIDKTLLIGVFPKYEIDPPRRFDGFHKGGNLRLR